MIGEVLPPEDVRLLMVTDPRLASIGVRLDVHVIPVVQGADARVIN
ncbi:MAG: hypothetical protein AAGG72_06880 [Pseudomonadota bacterium]